VRVKVLLFAALREVVGRPTCEIELATGATVRDLLDRLRGDFPALATVRFAVAVNRRYAEDSQPLADADELALIPPVSGG